MSEVSAIPAADSAAAFAHYSASLAFETDCADVHSAMAHGPNAADFVLLDAPSYLHLVYHFGVNLVSAVFCDGQRVA